MSTALIINAGEYSPIPKNLEYDYIIACDAGYNNAIKMDLKPDLIIGDFDSYKGDAGKDFGDIPVQKYNVMKDDTDSMLAIKKAIFLGHTHIIQACSLGGRMDHTIANIQSMSYIAERGLTGEILSENETMCILKGNTSCTFEKKEGYSFSVFSLTNKSTGVCISGALYNVNDIILENTFPLGLGNSWVDDKITVSVKQGQLLIIESKINE